MQPQPVMVDELVGGMRELIARSLGPDIRITLDLPDALPVVRADPNHLESALLNLMVNARDAMPSGGEIVVRVRDETIGPGHRTHLRPGRYVVMAVADKGEGMDQTTLARAREPFFTTKGVGKGTGLGLSMVDGLAAQLAGRMHIDSEPGAGTTVEVWLPAALEVAAAEPAPEETPDAGLSSQAAARSLTVLAVDDDGAGPDEYRVDARRPRPRGRLTAISAMDALEILRQQPEIDLVITDHAMPQMTGCQLAGEIDDAGRTFRSSWPPAMPSCRRAPTRACRGCPNRSAGSNSPLRSRRFSSGRNPPLPVPPHMRGHHCPGRPLDGGGGCCPGRRRGNAGVRLLMPDYLVQTTVRVFFLTITGPVSV